VHAVSGRTLATYRLGDGSSVWSVDVLAEVPSVFTTAKPPRVRGDLLYVPRELLNVAYSTTNVFDARTGAAVPGDLPYGLSSLDGDELIATEYRQMQGGFFMSWLHSTNLADPSQSWEILYEGENTESAVSDEWIVSIVGSTVRGFPRTGGFPAERCEGAGQWIRCNPAWITTLAGQATVPSISDDGQTVFVGDAAGNLSALDIDDGTARWTGQVHSAGPILAAPTVGDGSVFVSTQTGQVFAFAADGCSDADVPPCDPLWRTGVLDVPVRQQAALAGGVLYVGANDGSIRAFDVSACGGRYSCDPVWQTWVGRAITGAPAVDRGHLLVGTADGRLIAFRPAG
jgi:hypothetical protein